MTIRVLIKVDKNTITTKLFRSRGTSRRTRAATRRPRRRSLIVERAIIAAVVLGAVAVLPTSAREKSNSIIVQSTTSTANSGLYDDLLPRFFESTGIEVYVVAVGTGQAMRNARNCDGDVLLVHSRDAETQFVNDGYGVERFDVMYNDFIIVGPADNPAKLAKGLSVTDALRAIAETESLFVSRADDSGTHMKELELWGDARIDALAASGRWYRETGSGMGATLNAAIGMDAYVLTDRATWLSFNNQRDFSVFVENDDALFNQYGVVLVNPARCSSVNAVSGQAFVDWILSPQGQDAIENFRVHGEQLFFPNASQR